MMDKQFFNVTLASYFIRVLAGLVLLSIQFLLGRHFGVEGYGLYSWLISFVLIGIVCTQAGVSNAAMRFVPKYIANQQYDLLKRFFIYALGIVLVASCVCALLFTLGVYLPQRYPVDLQTVLYAALLIVVASFAIFLSQWMRAFHRVILSALPLQLLYPLSFALFILYIAYLHDGETGLASIFLSQAAAYGFALIFVVIGCFLLTRTASKPEHIQVKQAGNWHRPVFLAFLIALLALVNERLDLIMIGFLLSTKDAGIYQAASTLTMPILLSLVALNQWAVPTMSKLYETDESALKQFALQCGKLSLLLALPIALCAVGFAGVGLAIFGQAYLVGIPIVYVLAATHLFNALMGPIGMMLIVCGFESDSLKGVVAALIVNAIFNYILVMQYGLIGAAIATLLATVVFNCVYLFYVFKRKLPIPSALGYLFR